MQERVAGGNTHPMELKKTMAHDIVAKFWSLQEADAAQKQFEDLFQKRDLSAAQEINIEQAVPNPIWIGELLKVLKVVATGSEGRRLIEQGAVYIDGEVLKDVKAEITLRNDMIIKAGKHKIFKIKMS